MIHCGADCRLLLSPGQSSPVRAQRQTQLCPLRPVPGCLVLLLYRYWQNAAAGIGTNYPHIRIAQAQASVFIKEQWGVVLALRCLGHTHFKGPRAS